MFQLQSRPRKSKYIVLEITEFGVHNKDEIRKVSRGEIFEKVDGPDISSDVMYLLDTRRRQKLTCPTKTVARLTDFEVDHLMSIRSIEERYGVFQAGNRLENLPRKGSKVFVTVKGRELSGIVRYISSNYDTDIPIFGVQLFNEVDVEEHCLLAGTFTKSELDVLFHLPNGGIGVVVARGKLRPHLEKKERPSSYPNRRILRMIGDDERRIVELGSKLSSQRDAYENIGKLLTDCYQKLAAEQQAHEETKRILKENQRKSSDLEIISVSIQQALEEKETYLIESEDISDGFEKELNIQQQIYKKLEQKSIENERWLVFQEKAREDAENLSTELENKFTEEKHTHEQTKELLKVKSKKVNKCEQSQENTQSNKNSSNSEHNWLVGEFETKEQTIKELETRCQITEQETKELKQKLACEQKTRKELENTVATAQKSLKNKRRSEKECDWMLKREEIDLTPEKLGSGNFGTVYKGIFRGTKIAVKQVSMKPRITAYNKDSFRREMRMAARCRHPCMLQFLGATSDDQSPLLVTELLDTSLKDVLFERALERTEIKTIALDVAKGLNYLHLNQPHSIVHRDISSGNVLLWKHGESWRGKVSDYGNAVMMNYARTGSGGALPYLAPEIENQRFSTKSDVYSYGVLLLEMCVREDPSCHDDRDELICLVENGDLRSLIRDCLREDPLQRPSMREIISVLNERISDLTETQA